MKVQTVIVPGPRVLVTGAAGFMGSHLFDYLRKEAGCQVIGVDNYSLGTYRHADINKIDLYSEPGLTEELIKSFKPTIIYHLAAWAHEGLSQFSPNLIIKNNLNAYMNVLVPAIKYGVQRMVLTSSMAVYGNQTPPFSEDMDRKPVDLYGISKQAMEEATEVLSRVHGLEYTIVRPHNVYGPRQNMADPYRNVVAIFINNCLRNKAMLVYGDGKQTRAFTYVHEIIPLIARCGWLPEAKNQIFNLGPREDHSILELASEISRYFPQSYISHVPDRPAEVKHAYSTSDKATKLLGYSNGVPFKVGIADMVAWAKQQGPQEPKYLRELEITNNVPVTWKEHLI